MDWEGVLAFALLLALYLLVLVWVFVLVRRRFRSKGTKRSPFKVSVILTTVAFGLAIVAIVIYGPKSSFNTASINPGSGNVSIGTPPEGRHPPSGASLPSGPSLPSVPAPPGNTTIPSGPPSHPSAGAEQTPAFPWPPPPPSVFVVIPPNELRARVEAEVDRELKSLNANDDQRKSSLSSLNLREVNYVLRQSLWGAGYGEISYYSVPQGFALVAELERMNADGTSFEASLRFDPNFRPLSKFTLQEYLRALFFAPPGYYRVIAFIVSPVSFSPTAQPISAREASLLVEGGVNRLPGVLASLPFSSDTVCTALVYEFEKRDAGSNPTEKRPGRLSALVHLRNSRIWEGLWTSQ